MVINIANRFSWIFLILLLSSLHLYSQKVNLIDKLKNNKISIIEINTSGGAQIVSKEDYLTASYTLYTYKNGAYTTLSDSTEIKVISLWQNKILTRPRSTLK